MTRTLGSLAAHVAGRAHKLAYMLRLDLKDGATVALTDHDRVLSVDLGDGAADYLPDPGVNISDVTLAAGFSTSNFEATGPIVPPFTRAAVLGGRFRGATARLFMVNWADLTDVAAIMRGQVAECRVEGSRWVLEVRNAADAFQQTQGGVLSPYCRTWFGSPQCGIVRTAYPAEVTAVASDDEFTVDLAGVHPDDFFNYGNAAFTAGELAGTDEARVMDYVGATGVVTLFEPLFQPPEVGDAVTLYRGCSKLLKSPDPALPTCLFWGNVVNFRGHPEVPGSRYYHKVNDPGASYD